jgi:undecaprenyl-diphosphatase
MPPYLLPESVQVLILAIIQGIAEFLPISSSGHLVVVSALFGMKEGSAELNIILHFGTLLAIVLFYWKRIVALLSSDRKVIPLLIVGTIPAVVIGLVIKKLYPWITEYPLLAGFMLPVTGMMLLLLPKIKKGETEYQDMTYLSAFLIGCAQAFAILPGISRSGSTIVAGSFLGLKRQAAATFSFLLAIPVILGATVLEVKDMMESETGSTIPVWLLAAGALVSFAVGLVALRWLVQWVEKGKLHWFAYWLIPFGFLIVIWQLYEYVQSQVS